VFEQGFGEGRQFLGPGLRTLDLGDVVERGVEAAHLAFVVDVGIEALLGVAQGDTIGRQVGLFEGLALATQHAVEVVLVARQSGRADHVAQASAGQGLGVHAQPPPVGPVAEAVVQVGRPVADHRGRVVEDRPQVAFALADGRCLGFDALFHVLVQFVELGLHALVFQRAADGALQQVGVELELGQVVGRAIAAARARPATSLPAPVIMITGRAGAIRAGRSAAGRRRWRRPAGCRA
jgi:hypothetical protein